VNALVAEIERASAEVVAKSGEVARKKADLQVRAEDIEKTRQSADAELQLALPALERAAAVCISLPAGYPAVPCASSISGMFSWHRIFAVAPQQHAHKARDAGCPVLSQS